MKHIIAITLVGCILSLCGCGARCVVERDIVNAVDAGVAAAAVTVPEHSDEMDIARGVTSLGRAAVGACEVLRDGGGWQQWLMLALEATSGLVGIITGAADEDVPEVAPAELVEAVQLLEGATR